MSKEKQPEKKDIKWKDFPTYSSNLKRYGYDKKTRKLQIEFKNGGQYEYSEVPQEVVDELLQASSHGEYFSANIQKGSYEYQKL